MLTVHIDIVVCRSDDFADGKEGDKVMTGFGSGGGGGEEQDVQRQR